MIKKNKHHPRPRDLGGLFLSVWALFLTACEGTFPEKKPCLLEKNDLCIREETLLTCYKGSVLYPELLMQERIKAALLMQRVLDTGAYLQPYFWHHEETGLWGSITLLRSHPLQEKMCITLEERLQNPVKTLVVQGLACRNNVGLWSLVQETTPHIYFRQE